MLLFLPRSTGYNQGSSSQQRFPPGPALQCGPGFLISEFTVSACVVRCTYVGGPLPTKISCPTTPPEGGGPLPKRMEEPPSPAGWITVFPPSRPDTPAKPRGPLMLPR